MLENNGHIHVYSPGAGAEKPLGSKCFHKHKFSVVCLVFWCKLFPLNDYVTVLPHSHAHETTFDHAVKKVKVNPGPSFI